MALLKITGLQIQFGHKAEKIPYDAGAHSTDSDTTGLTGFADG